MGISFEEPYPGPDHEVTLAEAFQSMTEAFARAANVYQQHAIYVSRQIAKAYGLQEAFTGSSPRVVIIDEVSHNEPKPVKPTPPVRDRSYPRSDPSRSRSGRRLR